MLFSRDRRVTPVEDLDARAVDDAVVESHGLDGGVSVPPQPVAAQARQRAAAYTIKGVAYFLVKDLTSTGLPWASVSAAVAIDAIQFTGDRAVAA